MPQTNYRLQTFRKIDTQHGPPWNLSRYDTLDYILVPNRWNKSCHKIETDINANLHTNQYPMVMTSETKFKRHQNKTVPVPKYLKCDMDERLWYNDQVSNVMPENGLKIQS